MKCMKRQNTFMVCIVLFALMFSLLAYSSSTYSVITGDAPPASGNWIVGNSTTIQGETISVTGTTTVKQGKSLEISDSTFTFHGDVSLERNASLMIHNSTIIFKGNFSSQQYTTTILNASDIMLSGSMALQGKHVGMENTTIMFKATDWTSEGYILASASTIDMYHVLVDTEQAKNYVISILEPSVAHLYNCTLKNGGIPYVESGTPTPIPEVTLYSNSLSLSLEKCTILPMNGTGIFLDRGNATIKDTTISGKNISSESYGIAALHSIVEVDNATINRTNAAVLLVNAPFIAPNTPYSSIHNSTLSNNTYGIVLYNSISHIRDNALGGNDAGLRAINSAFISGLHNTNNFFSPEKNKEDAIRYERLLELKLTRVRGVPLSGASVSLEGSSWFGGYTVNGLIQLNGGLPIEAYIMDRNGTEEYFTYTIKASYDTGVYVSEISYFLDALNATYPNDMIELQMDAGPDIVLTSMKLSTDVAPSGSYIDVTLNVTNYWWYPATNVSVRVENDASFSETTIMAIPANSSVDVTLSIFVGNRDVDTTIEITGIVDASLDSRLEGNNIDRENNILKERLDVRAAMADSSVPLMGLLVAIAILLPIFIFSMYRAVSAQKKDDGTDTDGSDGEDKDVEPQDMPADSGDAKDVVEQPQDMAAEKPPTSGEPKDVEPQEMPAVGAPDAIPSTEASVTDADSKTKTEETQS